MKITELLTRDTIHLNIESKEKENVIDEMVTWFDYNSFEVLARNYSMSYNAGVYSFDVNMQVEMMRAGKYLIPRLIRYNGMWDVVFKKKEKGVFTATIFDVGNGQ